jgi:SIR2-like protein
LQRAAQRIDTGDPTTDFEALFGPFEQYRDGLDLIRDLAALTGDNILLQNALRLSADYIEEIRRTGVGHALDVIARRSKAILSGGPEVRDLIDSLVDAAGPGRLTIGNLNYDSLVMAALSEAYQPNFCDLTDGRQDPEIHRIDRYPASGRPLRTVQSFPMDRPIRLLHLHGSLAWLREPGTDGRVLRFDIGDLRRANYWDAYREGRTDWTPQVVLTNQASKTIEVTKYPYVLAYEAFYNKLLTADRWFIGGYSFRDGCVNDLLARTWRARDTTPDILVVTAGKEPRRKQILDAIGWTDWADPDPDDFLSVIRSGVRTAFRSDDARAWATRAKITKAILTPVP